jgi:hypothetical protein
VRLGDVGVVSPRSTLIPLVPMNAHREDTTIWALVHPPPC